MITFTPLKQLYEEYIEKDKQGVRDKLEKAKSTESSQSKVPALEAELALLNRGLAGWLLYSAPKISGSYISTHQPKITHSDVKLANVRYQLTLPERDVDLRHIHTANLPGKPIMDASGNSNLGNIVFQILNAPLKLVRGMSFYEALQSPVHHAQVRQETGLSKDELEDLLDTISSQNNADYDGENGISTSDLLKQVIVKDDKGLDRLLTIVKSSALLSHYAFTMRGRKSRPAAIKEGLERFQSIPGVMQFNYVGSNANNVSNAVGKFMNGTNNMIPALPPILNEVTRLPRRDFFNECLRYGEFKFFIEKLYNWENARENVETKQKREYWVGQCAKLILDEASLIQLNAGWSAGDNFSALPEWQKHWLDRFGAESDPLTSEDVEKIHKAAARYLMSAMRYYQEKLSLKVTVGDDYLRFLNKTVALFMAKENM